MKNNNLEKIRMVLCDTFPNSIVPENIRDLKLGDITEWDSMGNLNLLLAVEEVFEIRFSMDEMTKIKSIQELKEILEAK